MDEAFMEGLENSEKRIVQRYLDDHAQGKHKMLNERKIARIFLKHQRKRIVLSSASIAEDLLDVLEDTNVLIFDEATQASFAQIVHLLCFMPHIHSIIFAGDRRQLGVHLKDLPEVFQAGFGLESIIEQLESSPGVTKIFLKNSYRFHPFMAHAISAAAYEPFNENILAATPANLRASLINSQLLLPCQECPVVLIHSFSRNRRSPMSESVTDDHQSEIALFLARALINKGFAPKQITVLNMYSYQQEELEQILEPTNVQSVTVDGFQAQENEIVILITSKSRNGPRRGMDNAMNFFKENRRATVALSRAKAGLFLVGDLVAISEGDVWSRFIQRAITRTKPVTGDYAREAVNNTLNRLPSGALVGSTGPLIHQTFNNDWRAYHGQSNALQEMVEFRYGSRNDWPVVGEHSGGPMRGRDNANVDEQRGRGRFGARGRYIHYGGNVRTNQGQRREQ
jgi:hypothetical protein